MGRKTTVWIFQETNWWDYTQEDQDMAMKGKSQEINSNSSKSQCHKDQLC